MEPEPSLHGWATDQLNPQHETTAKPRSQEAPADRHQPSNTDTTSNSAGPRPNAALPVVKTEAPDRPADHSFLALGPVNGHNAGHSGAAGHNHTNGPDDVSDAKGLYLDLCTDMSSAEDDDMVDEEHGDDTPDIAQAATALPPTGEVTARDNGPAGGHSGAAPHDVVQEEAGPSNPTPPLLQRRAKRGQMPVPAGAKGLTKRLDVSREELLRVVPNAFADPSPKLLVQLVVNGEPWRAPIPVVPMRNDDAPRKLTWLRPASEWGSWLGCT